MPYVPAPVIEKLGDSEYEGIPADVLGTITPHLMLSIRSISL